MFGHLTGNDPRPHYFHQTNIARGRPDDARPTDTTVGGTLYAVDRHAARALRRGVRPRRRAARAAQPAAGRRDARPAGGVGSATRASGAVTAWLQDGAIHVANGGAAAADVPVTGHHRRRGRTAASSPAGSRWRPAPSRCSSRPTRAKAAAPAVTGAAKVGRALTATGGTWTGTPEIARRLRWQRCDAKAAARRRGCDRGDLRRDARRRRLVAPRRRVRRQLDLRRRPGRLRAHRPWCAKPPVAPAGAEARHEARRLGHRPGRQRRRPAQGPAQARAHARADEPAALRGGASPAAGRHPAWTASAITWRLDPQGDRAADVPAGARQGRQPPLGQGRLDPAQGRERRRGRPLPRALRRQAPRPRPLPRRRQGQARRPAVRTGAHAVQGGAADERRRSTTRPPRGGAGSSARPARAPRRPTRGRRSRPRWCCCARRTRGSRPPSTSATTSASCSSAPARCATRSSTTATSRTRPRRCSSRGS